MDTAQIITDNGTPKFAVLPYGDYLELMAKNEGYDDVEDYLDYLAAKKALSINEKWISHEDLKKEIEEAI